MREDDQDSTSRREERRKAARREIRKMAKQKLGLDSQMINALGVGSVSTQLAAREGMSNFVKCDADSQTNTCIDSAEAIKEASK